MWDYPHLKQFFHHWCIKHVIPSLHVCRYTSKASPSTVKHAHAKCAPSHDQPTPGSDSGHMSEYTTLATKGNDDHDVMLGPLGEQHTTSTEIGHSVHLVSTTYQVLGTAATMSGDCLHGHEIPIGYSKVLIQKIDSSVKSWPSVKEDDEDLTSGSITAWPTKFVRKVKL